MKLGQCFSRALKGCRFTIRSLWKTEFLFNTRFQWVAFQLQALRECLTLRDVKKTLNTLPKTLNATYTRVLENMNGNYYKHAMMILKLLALSRHPVSRIHLISQYSSIKHSLFTISVIIA